MRRRALLLPQPKQEKTANHTSKAVREKVTPVAGVHVRGSQGNEENNNKNVQNGHRKVETSYRWERRGKMEGEGEGGGE